MLLLPMLNHHWLNWLFGFWILSARDIELGTLREWPNAPCKRLEMVFGPVGFLSPKNPKP